MVSRELGLVILGFTVEDLGLCKKVTLEGWCFCFFLIVPFK